MNQRIPLPIELVWNKIGAITSIWIGENDMPPSDQDRDRFDEFVRAQIETAGHQDERAITILMCIALLNGTELRIEDFNDSEATWASDEICRIPLAIISLASDPERKILEKLVNQVEWTATSLKHWEVADKPNILKYLASLEVNP